MTEKMGPIINTTVAKSGSREWPEADIVCTWELHALPEYVEEDLGLSDGVMSDMALFLQEKGWPNSTIGLVEGYDNERSGEEHYRLTMIFGKGSDNKKMVFSKHYSAQTENEKVMGLVRVEAGLPSGSEDDHVVLEEKIVEIYIRNLEETYADWKNQWEDGRFISLV